MKKKNSFSYLNASILWTAEEKFENPRERNKQKYVKY